MAENLTDLITGDAYEQARALAMIRAELRHPEVVHGIVSGVVQVYKDPGGVPPDVFRGVPWEFITPPWDMGILEPYDPCPGTVIAEPYDFKPGGLVLAKAAYSGEWRSMYRIVRVGEFLLTESLDPMPHPYVKGQVVTAAGSPSLLPGSDAEHLRPRLLLSVGSITAIVTNPELASGTGKAFRDAAEAERRKRMSAMQLVQGRQTPPAGPLQLTEKAGR